MTSPAPVAGQPNNVVGFPAPAEATLPPHSADAEEAVLGSLLKAGTAIARIADSLFPDDFYNPRNKHCYAAMLHLHQQGAPIDYTSVGDQLEVDGTYDAAGGRVYLAEINVGTPTAVHIEHYAARVAEYSLLRQMISLYQAGTERAWRADKPADQLLLDLEDRVRRLRVRAKRASPTLADYMAATRMRYAAVQAVVAEGGTPMLGLACGHKGVDKLCMGFRAKTYTLLGARTGKGKSQLQIQWAVHMAQAAQASQDPGVVVYFSLEMSAEQWMDRVVAMEVHLPRWRVALGMLNPDERARVQAAMARVATLPLALELADRTTGDMRATLWRLAGQFGYIRAIYVDYVQLLADTKSRTSTRHEDLGVASAALAQVAKEFDCPVIASAQLSRGLDARPNPIPRLSDFRESGNLEQDADVVLTLVRNNTYAADDEEDGAEVAGEAAGIARVYKLKDRNNSDTRAGGNMCRLVWVEGGEFYADYEQSGAPRRSQGGYQQAPDLPF